MDNQEPRFDDLTPDKTPVLVMDFTAQQLYMIYDVLSDFNQEEQSTKVVRILDKLKKTLDRVEWSQK